MALNWQSTSIRDINQGTTANDGTGDTIRNAFFKVDENFANITAFFNGAISSGGADYSSGPKFATLEITNLDTTVANIGNLTLGNVNSQTYFYGNINVSANIVPTAYGQYDLGSVDRPFRNLYVETTVSTTQIAASSDAGLLLVHANTTPDDVKDVGIIGNVSNHFSSNMYAFFGYQATTDNFVYKLTPNNAATVGNSVVYDGAYGNVQFGALLLSNTTPATSNVTGALIVAGGISTRNDIHVAGNIFQRGFRAITTNDVSTLGYPTYNGTGSLFVGNTVFATTTPSTSTNTGAVVVLGGVGVAGNIVAGGYLGNYFGNIVNPVQTGITTVGSLGNLAVLGTTTTNSLQATAVGATNVLATQVNSQSIFSTTITGTNITGTNGSFNKLMVSSDNTAVAFETSASLTNNLITAARSVNNFVQAALRNGSNGGSASADFIAYADTGTNSRGFIDLGIAATGFNDPAFGITRAGDGYIFLSAPAYANAAPTGGNLVLATADGARGDIVFAAGGFVTGTEQGRFINGDGLSVTGNLISQAGAIYQGAGAKALITTANAVTTLSNTITSSQTTITVPSTAGFLVHGALYIRNELMYYTSKTSTQFTGITRGTSGTTAVSHNSGTTVYQPNSGLTNASTVLTGNADDFVQVAIKNINSGANASTDVIAYASNGDNDSGWINMGITSETFSASEFGVTGPDDGYLFMSAPAGTTGAGELVIATSEYGTTNDIVFATNGFESGNERMRIVGQSRAGKPAGVEIYIPTTSTSTSTGALRVQGGVGIQGNLFVGGNFNLVGNISIGGTGSTTSTSTLVVENPITFLANANPGDSQDIGIVGQYASSGTKYAGVVRDSATKAFRFFDGLTTKPTTTVNWAGTSAGNVFAGQLRLANTTVSSSTTSGALIVAGGAGIGGKLYVGGEVTVNGSIVPTANLTHSLGSPSSWWSTFYGVSTQARYADLAENYQADTTYEAGTVVIFGGNAEITTTSEFADSRVAGVISTNPAHLMNGGLSGEHVFPLALRGRVPCQVIGPVSKGDLLVTSEHSGYAVSVGNDRLYSVSVFAKALETDLSIGKKVIEAVIL
jgi:hypothetical protein